MSFGSLTIFVILLLIIFVLYKLWLSKSSQEIGDGYADEVRKIHKKYDDLGF